MNTYAAAELAQQIGISKTSLNYYINILEETGYQVSRNARKHREYTEKDLGIIRQLIDLNKHRGVKLKEAAKLVTAPGYQGQMNELQAVQGNAINTTMQNKYDEISRSMELLATHVYGIEQQNAQLLELIKAQREQNELLMEQNDTLKQELGAMMNHLLDQANAPNEAHQRQLNRVEQQNSAIMSVLNKLNEQQQESKELGQVTQEIQKTGFFNRFKK